MQCKVLEEKREEVEAAEREISRNPRFCVLCRLYCGDVCVCVVCFSYVLLIFF